MVGYYFGGVASTPRPSSAASVPWQASQIKPNSGSQAALGTGVLKNSSSQFDRKYSLLRSLQIRPITWGESIPLQAEGPHSCFVLTGRFLHRQTIFTVRSPKTILSLCSIPSFYPLLLRPSTEIPCGLRLSTKLDGSNSVLSFFQMPFKRLNWLEVIFFERPLHSCAIGLFACWKKNS